MTGRTLRGDHCRCTACQQFFNSTRAFDKHRRGAYPDRRCLTPEEMLAAGMAKNTGDWWVSAALKMAPAYLHRDDRGGDQSEAAPCS